MGNASIVKQEPSRVILVTTRVKFVMSIRSVLRGPSPSSPVLILARHCLAVRRLLTVSVTLATPSTRHIRTRYRVQTTLVCRARQACTKTQLARRRVRSVQRTNTTRTPGLMLWVIAGTVIQITLHRQGRPKSQPASATSGIAAYLVLNAWSVKPESIART